MEEEYQKKLINCLPIYYPGISGCRNILEFENLNKIEGILFKFNKIF